MLTFAVGTTIFAANGFFLKDPSKSISNTLGKNKVTFKNRWLYDFYFHEVANLEIKSFLGRDDFYLINGILIKADEVEIIRVLN